MILFLFINPYFFRSIQPLLNDTEFRNTEKVVDDFIKEGGIGRYLYHKLLKKYENTDNWVA